MDKSNWAKKIKHKSGKLPPDLEKIRREQQQQTAASNTAPEEEDNNESDEKPAAAAVKKEGTTDTSAIKREPTALSDPEPDRIPFVAKKMKSENDDVKDENRINSTEKAMVPAGNGNGQKTFFQIPVPGVNGARPDCFDGHRFVLTGIFPEVRSFRRTEERNLNICITFSHTKRISFFLNRLVEDQD
jgi:hypothetical protein